MARIKAALWPEPHPIPDEYLRQQMDHLETLRRANRAVAELRSMETAAVTRARKAQL